MSLSSGMKKRKQMILFAIGIILCFIPGLAMGIVNPPHNAGADCGSCHFTYSSTPAWWTNPPADLDDTPKNRLCLNCHDDSTAPSKKPHSSLAMGSTKYGDWTNECVTCHDPHMQRQIYNNEFPTGLTGTITSVDAGTKTFTLSINLPDRTGDSNPANDYKGWTIVPNTRYKTVNYKITSNTANTVTVTTAINTARVSVGSTFGILYGKYIKELVYTPNSGPKYVKFYQTENGPHSYVNNDGLNGGQDSTPDGICQVCHTQTTRARNDGTGFGDAHPTDTSANCQSCHDHANSGFAGVGGCTNCHGYPPANDATLVFKDRNGIDVTSSSTGGNPGAGAHSAHITAGLDCLNCHTGGMLGGAGEGNDMIDIGFNLGGNNLGGTYDGQPNPPKSVFPLNGGGTTTITTGGTYNCSNVYCHSTGQGSTANDPTPAYATPKWDTPSSGACGTCHSNTDPGTGSHTAHLSSTVTIQCGDCHTGAGDGSSYSSSNHVNKLIDVANSYNAGGTPGNGYGECSTQACHGGDGSTPNSPTWGTDFSGLSDPCTRCHGTDGTNAAPPKDLMGDTATNDPQVGAHQAHLQGSDSLAEPIACTECHIVPADVADAGHIKDATPGTAEVDFTNATKAILNSSSPVYTSGTCNSVYCHGANLPNSTTDGNDTTPLWSDNAYINGTASHDCAQCHGYPPDPVTIPAHSGKGPTDCVSCHDTVNATGDAIAILSQHIDGTVEVSGCNSCHGQSGPTGAPLVSGDEVSPPTGGVGVGQHPTHVTTLSYTCTTCHSGTTMPTEDDEITIGFSGLANGGTYDGVTNLNAPYSYSANVTTGGTTSCSNIYCHSTVQANGGTGAPTYATPDWSNSASVQCGTCHKADGVQGNATLMDTGTHTKHVSTYGFQCSDCHSGAGAGTGKHVDQNIDVIISASYGGSYAGMPVNAPQDGYSSCSSVYCHSDGAGGAPNNTPTWGTTLPADCTGCHNNDTASASAMSSGSHTQHMGAGATTTVGRQLGCVDCHAQTVSDNRTISDYTKHVNQTKDIWVNIDNSGCNNIQCHSSGNFDGTLTYNNPVWGTDTLDCTSCHGDGATKAYPSYADGGAGTGDSNSHNAHVGTNGLNCEECHQFTSVNGTSIDGTDPTKHVNQAVDISFKQGGTYNAGAETCSTTYCHGTGTPQWGGTVACGDCHAVNNTLADTHSTHWSVATNATATDRTTAANKSTTANYQFSCAVCHNSATHAGGPVGGGQTAEITFDGTVAGGGTYTKGGTTNTDPNGFDYTDGSCSSTYCHSDGASGAPNVTPTWGATLDCKSCHNYTVASGSPMASGSHTAHINDGTVMSNKSCEDCHNATTTNGTTIADKTKHVNHTKDVVITATYGGAYSAGNCSASYCHSDATALTAPYNAPNTDLVWGTGTADCNSCHDGTTTGPAYANGSPKANSHDMHVVQSGFNCVDCHNATVDSGNNIANPANHLNKAYDVSGTDIGSYDTGTKTCNTVYCHSDVQADGGNAGPTTYATPTWGGTVACDDCHGQAAHSNGQPATGSHETHVTTNGLNCNECHNNAGDGTTLHADKTIDISLLQGGTYSQGSHTPGSGGYGTCSTTYCHGSGTPQWGGTVACGDCHDVNNNLEGRHPTHYATATNATATDRSNAANNSTTGTYIFSCAVCHNGATHAGGAVGGGQVAEITFDGTIAGGGTYTPGTGNAGGTGDFDWTSGSCSTTYCHSDGNGGAGNTPVNWGMAAGSLDCKSCHNYTAASGSPMASGSHTAHINDGTVMSNKGCEDCHNATTTDGTTIADKTKHVNQTKDVALSATWGGTFSGGDCSTVYCHSDGKTSPAYATVTWGSGTADCVFCHGGAGGSNGGAGTALSASHTVHTNTGGFNYGCENCHSETATDSSTIGTPANHVNKSIDVAVSAANGGTGTIGGDYSAGSCSTTNCHGSASPDWTAGATTGDCSACHGMAANPADARDTNGDTANTDIQVGAHAAHLTATHGISSAIACDECHTVPTGASYEARVKAAGHIDDSLPAEVPLAGTIATGSLEGPGVTTSYSGNGGTCAVYCHDGSKFKNGWSSQPPQPDWNTPFMSGTSADCSKCHGYPPGGGHTTSTTCHNCHTHVNATDDGFTDASLHINGTVEAQSGTSCDSCHSYPPATGAHTVHYTNITNSYGTWNTDPTQTSWDGTTHNVCGTCHDMSNTANHMDTADHISPAGEAFDSGTPPAYETNFSCSNIRCHFGTSPAWK